MGMFGGSLATGVSVAFEHQQLAAPSDFGGLTTEEQKLNVNAAVYSTMDNSLSLLAKGDRMRLGNTLVFPKAGVAIPKEFGSAEVGAGWVEKDVLENKFGFSATFGSAGTQLLTRTGTPIVTGTMFWERASMSRHSWLYFLSYSNNRTTLNNVPVPGLAYTLTGKEYRLMLGLPFVFLNWRPGVLSTTFAISPFGGTADLGLRVWGPLQVFSSVGWTPRSYQNLVEGSKDRLIVDKKELQAGLRVNMGPKMGFTLAYIQSFNRKFILGESVFKEAADSLKVEDAGGFVLKARFPL